MLPIYGAAIKVIAGFYLGCTGIVTSPHNAYIDRYEVELTCEYSLGARTTTDRVTTVIDLINFQVTNTPRQEAK